MKKEAGKNYKKNKADSAKTPKMKRVKRVGPRKELDTVRVSRTTGDVKDHPISSTKSHVSPVNVKGSQRKILGSRMKDTSVLLSYQNQSTLFQKSESEQKMKISSAPADAPLREADSIPEDNKQKDSLLKQTLPASSNLSPEKSGTKAIEREVRPSSLGRQELKTSGVPAMHDKQQQVFIPPRSQPLLHDDGISSVVQKEKPSASPLAVIKPTDGEKQGAVSPATVQPSVSSKMATSFSDKAHLKQQSLDMQDSSREGVPFRDVSQSRIPPVNKPGTAPELQGDKFNTGSKREGASRNVMSQSLDQQSAKRFRDGNQISRQASSDGATAESWEKQVPVQVQPSPGAKAANETQGEIQLPISSTADGTAKASNRFPGSRLVASTPNIHSQPELAGTKEGPTLQPKSNANGPVASVTSAPPVLTGAGTPTRLSVMEKSHPGKNRLASSTGASIPQKKILWPVLFFIPLALIAGLGIGGGVAYYWYGHLQGYKYQLTEVQEKVKRLESEKETLASQLEESYLKLHNMQIGLNQMNKLFETIGEPPSKPRYQRAGEGVIIYWLDGMLWRRYHIYQARGRNGQFKKLNKRSTKKNYLYLENMKPGIWRYAITALDREGRETEMSEVLEIKIRP